jgi:uncharacterized protein
VGEQFGDVQLIAPRMMRLASPTVRPLLKQPGRLGPYSSGSFSITIAKLSNRIAALPLGCDHHTTRQCPGVIFPARVRSTPREAKTPGTLQPLGSFGLRGGLGSFVRTDRVRKDCSRCSTIWARCGTMGFAMATDVQAPDAALVERERVMRALREHEAELRALGVTRLWLFGSLARGDPGRRSDVDVLISVPPAQKFSLLDLAGVRVELCDLLGRDTDVVIREDVQPRFWETIRDDLVEVF